MHVPRCPDSSRKAPEWPAAPAAQSFIVYRGQPWGTCEKVGPPHPGGPQWGLVTFRAGERIHTVTGTWAPGHLVTFI